MRGRGMRGGGVCAPALLTLMLMLYGCAGSASDGDVDGVGGSVGGGTETGSVSMRLTWDASVFNEDGSAAVDLAGYRIYDGMSSGVYTQVTDVGNLTDVVVEDFQPGTYYIAVTAYDFYGNESAYSREVVAVLSES